MPPPPVLHILNHSRQKRNEDYRKNYQGEVALHYWNIPKEISRINKDRNPRHAAGHVVEKKPPVSHPTDPSDKRCERANYWNKSRQNHRLSAIFLVEAVRPFKMLPVEEPRTLPLKDPRTDRISDPIIDVVSDYRRSR